VPLGARQMRATWRSVGFRTMSTTNGARTFFVLLSGYFVAQDAYLESTISILTVLAWIAATTEALDLVLERYS
jgi:hypothetical protein